MRWDDLSIWTRTSARAGVRPVIVKARHRHARNTSLASHPPDNRFMIARRLPVLTGQNDVVFNYTCKDRMTRGCRHCG